MPILINPNQPLSSIPKAPPEPSSPPPTPTQPSTPAQTPMQPAPIDPPTIPQVSKPTPIPPVNLPPLPQTPPPPEPIIASAPKPEVPPMPQIDVPPAPQPETPPLPPIEIPTVPQSPVPTPPSPVSSEIPTPPPASTTTPPQEPPKPPEQNTTDTKPAKKLPIKLIIAVSTGLVFVVLFVVLALVLQGQNTPTTPTPTPTPTPTATVTTTPTPLPTVNITKNFQIELLDSQGLVTKVAEFTPEGSLVNLTDTVQNSPYAYRKTDTKGNTTEIGQISPDGKYRVRSTPTTLEIAPVSAPTTLKKFASASSNQYIQGRFVSNTEYFFYAYANNCAWETICQQTPKSSFIYLIETNELKQLFNDNDYVLANYVGATATHYLLTPTLKGPTAIYFMVNKKSFTATKVTIPSAKYDALLWGPEIDASNARLFYLSEGFTDTVEVTLFDLPKVKEDVITEMPKLVKKADRKATDSLTYNAVFFNNHRWAYVTLMNDQKDKTPVAHTAKTYLFSLPDEQAKEITPDPTLSMLLEGKTFGGVAWNNTNTMGLVVIDERKTVLVIDASDPFKPIGKKVILTGTLPAYSNMRAAGWKE